MKKVMCGNEMDRMPDWGFRMMAFVFKISDFFKSPDKKLDPFNIKKGQTVIDYGCGTGRYLKQASELVGEAGTVYAIDIHQLAIESANNQIKKFSRKNVKAIMTDGKTVNISSHTVDVIYALDMFHMVKDTNSLLRELNRVMKSDGRFFLEDGHQPRSLTKDKVQKSGCWEISEEKKRYLICKPKK